MPGVRFIKMNAIKPKSFSFVISLGFVAVMLVFIAVTMSSGLYNQYKNIHNNAAEDINQKIMRLTTNAERLFNIDPQLVDDEITQVQTDPRVVFAALIDASGIVRYSTNFAWREKPAKENIPYYAERFADNTKNKKSVHIQKINDSSDLVAMMSFIEPSTDNSIRSLRHGIIMIVYNLQQEEKKAFNFVLLERSVELFVALFVSIFLIWITNAFISRPLKKLQIAAKDYAHGNFKNQLIPSGPEEISEAAIAFNQMAGAIDEHVKEIQAKSQYNKTIIDNVFDAVVAIDTEGTIASFNLAAEQIFGYSEEAVIGKNVNMLMPEPYSSEHASYLLNYLNGGEAKIVNQQREIEGLKSNGETFPIELAVSEIEIDGVKTFIGIIRDISERKKVDRLKNEFISTVSHELRTPLTALNGAVNLIASGAFGELSEQAMQLIKNAKRNGDRLLTLINDLLDMEKMVAGKMQFTIDVCDLQSIIDDAMSVNETYAKQYNVSFIKTGIQETIDINVDRNRLEQVLSNFLSNACKFSPPESEIQINVDKLGNNVKVSVIDCGEGIPESFKVNIFQKFTQVDSSMRRKTGGTGLGLSICKELIERMQGSVGFESVEGVGSTFYFIIPQYFHQDKKAS